MYLYIGLDQERKNIRNELKENRSLMEKLRNFELEKEVSDKYEQIKSLKREILGQIEKYESSDRFVLPSSLKKLKEKLKTSENKLCSFGATHLIAT